MPLCGSQSGCGCAITSTPAVSGAIGGHLPTIDVSGSGQPGDPWDLSLNDGWADAVADAINGYEWTPWNPGITGLTLGTGAVRLHLYARINNIVHIFDRVILGSGGAVTGSVTMQRPFTESVGGTNPFPAWMNGAGILTMSATGMRPLMWRASGGTNMTALYMNMDGAGVLLSNLSATTPHTWTENSAILRWGSYMAT